MRGLVRSRDSKAQMWPRGGSHPGYRPAKPSTGSQGKEVGGSWKTDRHAYGEGSTRVGPPRVESRGPSTER